VFEKTASITLLFNTIYQYKLLIMWSGLTAAFIILGLFVLNAISFAFWISYEQDVIFRWIPVNILPLLTQLFLHSTLTASPVLTSHCRAHAVAAINNAFQKYNIKCVENRPFLTQSWIDIYTRKTPSSPGWGVQLTNDALVTRCPPENCTGEPASKCSIENTQYAVGILAVLTNNDVTVFESNCWVPVAARSDHTNHSCGALTDAKDVVNHILNEQQRIEQKLRQQGKTAQGTLVTLRFRDFRDGPPTNQAVIQAATPVLDTKSTCNLPRTGTTTVNASCPILSNDGNTLGDIYRTLYIDALPIWLESLDDSVECFINNHTVDISNDEDMLSYYGFELVGNRDKITTKSAIGIVPIIPVYYGEHYHRYIRGGLFIEKHDPIHLWKPTFNTSMGRGGYVLAGKQVRTVGQGNKPGTDFLLARISIPPEKVLIAAPDAWHCDGTLSGGVYIASYGFGKGGPEDAKENVREVGFVISHLSDMSK
jgi:hypothetical protein